MRKQKRTKALRALDDLAPTLARLVADVDALKEWVKGVYIDPWQRTRIPKFIEPKEKTVEALRALAARRGT